MTSLPRSLHRRLSRHGGVPRAMKPPSVDGVAREITSQGPGLPAQPDPRVIHHVMLTDTWQAKLIDFGLASTVARIVATSQHMCTSATNASCSGGTIGYILVHPLSPWHPSIGSNVMPTLTVRRSSAANDMPETQTRRRSGGPGSLSRSRPRSRSSRRGHRGRGWLRRKSRCPAAPATQSRTMRTAVVSGMKRISRTATCGPARPR